MSSLFSNIKQKMGLSRLQIMVIFLAVLLLGGISIHFLLTPFSGGMIQVEQANISSTPSESPQLHNSPDLIQVTGSNSSDLTNATKIEMRIYSYINAERVAYQQEPYIYNTELAEVARNWSRWRAMEGHAGHETANSIGPRDRMEIAGYFCDGPIIGENVHQRPVFKNTIAPNRTDIYPDSPNKVARYSVQEFMDSPGHRWGMLAPYYDVIGVGIYITNDNIVYVTHLFCARKNSFDQAVNASTTDRFIVEIADHRAVANESYYEGLPEAPEMPDEPTLTPVEETEKSR